MLGKTYCAECLKPGSFKCSRCRSVAYCSKDHQKVHWKIHKTECLEDVMIGDNDELGNHLVSRRFIPEGRIILREDSLVTAPVSKLGLDNNWDAHLFSEAALVCFGCYAELREERYCFRCGCTICSPKCAMSAVHKPECEIVVKYRKSRLPRELFHMLPNSLFFILRCLYLRTHDNATWNKIVNLQDRSKITRRLEPIISVLEIANFIKHSFNYNNFTTEELIILYTIYNVNSFSSIRQLYSAIYDKVSRAEHNCLPNCRTYIDEDGKIVLQAVKNINKGEHISLSYFQRPCGREKRQRILINHFYITCKCKRCTEPTEAEINLNSIKCPDMKCNGYITPRLTSVYLHYDWKCTSCKIMLEQERVNLYCLLLCALKMKIYNNGIESNQVMFRAAELIYHPTHESLLPLKTSFLLACDLGNPSSISFQELEYIVDTWDSIFSIVSQLRPDLIQLREELAIIGCLLEKEVSKWVRLDGERISLANMRKKLAKLDAIRESIVKFIDSKSKYEVFHIQFVPKKE